MILKHSLHLPLFSKSEGWKWQENDQEKYQANKNHLHANAVTKTGERVCRTAVCGWRGEEGACCRATPDRDTGESLVPKPSNQIPQAQPAGLNIAWYLSVENWTSSCHRSTWKFSLLIFNSKSGRNSCFKIPVVSNPKWFNAFRVFFFLYATSKKWIFWVFLRNWWNYEWRTLWQKLKVLSKTAVLQGVLGNLELSGRFSDACESLFLPVSLPIRNEILASVALSAWIVNCLE